MRSFLAMISAGGVASMWLFIGLIFGSYLNASTMVWGVLTIINICIVVAATWYTKTSFSHEIAQEVFSYLIRAPQGSSLYEYVHKNPAADLQNLVFSTLTDWIKDGRKPVYPYTQLLTYTIITQYQVLENSVV